ncbi:MAG TPA: VWA domain-containing protein [Candidatus Limnocylindrales bacterium]|nr:VWA domain-containing protein [Candidatus Limnocylindrales bacterium]
MGQRNGADRPSGERGQILVLFALVIVLVMGMVALAVDVGVLRGASQNLWNALDAGALAGVSQLPTDGVAADTLASQYLQENYPDGIPAANTTVSFRCLIGSVGGSPRLSDVPAVCDPGPGATWISNSSISVALCDPAAGDKCNTIVLTGHVTVPYGFGPAIGVNDGSTGVVTSAACKGPCGSPPENPIDIVLVVDRTQSMNGVDTSNARAASHSVRTMLNPTQQWLGYGMLGPSASAACITRPAGSIGTAIAPADVPRWVPVGLSGSGAPVNQDYTSGSSTLANAITCYTNSSTGTDLRDPIPMATYALKNTGRAGVKKAIILMTDGQPNASTVNPGGSNYCQQANQAATAAKSAGIEIFTVAFGLDGANNPNCPDTSGAFLGKKASVLVASMATNSTDDNGCPGTENDDGDNYFCVPKTAGASADLSNAFKTATNQLISGSKLVQLP